MRTVDRTRMRAPVARVLDAAVDVERWPALLPHYRWVRRLERRGDGGLVEMAAWRPFGAAQVSDLVGLGDVGGPGGRRRCTTATSGASPRAWTWSGGSRRPASGTDVTIVHDWTGPRWPLIGSAAASWVIGPVFIHGIASRTLAGIRRAVETAS